MHILGGKANISGQSWPQFALFLDFYIHLQVSQHRISKSFFCPPTVAFGYKRRTRTHIKKLGHTFQAPVCPGHVQIFEPFDWLKGYKIAFSYLYRMDFASPKKNGFYHKALKSIHRDHKNHTNPDQAI